MESAIVAAVVLTWYSLGMRLAALVLLAGVFILMVTYGVYHYFIRD